MTACLDEETVLLAAMGELAADAQATVDGHIDECAACRRLLLLCARAGVGAGRTSVAATIAEPYAREGSDELAIGARVDRYVVEGRLGAGAMGVVYAAHDPDLDRRVALKVLRDADHARLLREGRAVARLSHAHVIAVHDVGVAAGHAFIVMELVDGESVGEWLRARRGWRDVISIFRDAGRGLAAAHAAGLVHRDFKPANVLVGGGRVKVGDFGLAREGDGAGGGDDVLDVAVTRSGALVGTPAYMAPEQLDGEPATAASDQFSYAVALWEGVYGARPFAGATVGALRAAIARGVEAGGASREERDVPAWLRAALVRALAEDPAARFASIDELLAAITPAARSRRGAWIALGVAAVAAAGVAAFAMVGRARAASPCAGLGVGGAWGTSRRAQVEHAFAHVPRPYAKDALAATERALDAYAAAWTRADTDSCEAAEVARSESAETREAKRACFDQLRRELDDFTSLLASADDDLAARAPLAAAALSSPAMCADQRALGRRRLPADPQLRLQVAAQASRLASARALFIAGRYDAAASALAPVQAAAGALGYRPLEADVLLLAGKVALQRGDAATAERDMADAARAAEASRDDLTAADARIDRVGAVTYAAADLSRADDFVRDAQAALDRLGGDPERLATLFEYRGELASLAGHPALAVAYHTPSLALRRAVLPADADDTTTAMMDLARALDDAGHGDQARAILDDALARRLRRLGPDHPLIADLLTNRGVTFAEEGDFAHADADWKRALAIREATVAPDHPAIGMLLTNLAYDARDERRYDDALAMFRRAQAIDTAHGRAADAARRGGDIAMVYFEQQKCDDAGAAIAASLRALEAAVGADHSDVAVMLGEEAEIDICRQRYDDALAAGERARAIDERALGDGHPRTASDWETIGVAYAHKGDDARALAAYGEALRRKEAALGPDHLDLAATLANMSDSLVALGRFGEALPLVQRSLAIQDKAYGPTSARLAFPLRGVAQALAGLGRTADARAAYARAIALDGFDELGDLAAAIRREAKALR